MSDAQKMALWHALERTDPAYVKPITGKPYRGSSPNPTWVAMRLTEAFGPCGHGWRIEILNERFIEGAPVGDPPTPELVHEVAIRLHTVVNGQWGWSDHVGQTIMRSWRRPRDGGSGRWDLDEDAPKKSVTDAMVKAASLLGLCADIFTGRWDDSKYQAELAQEAQQKAVQARVADAERLAQPHITAITTATTPELYADARAKARAAWPAIRNLDPGVADRISSMIAEYDQLHGWKDRSRAGA